MIDRSRLDVEAQKIFDAMSHSHPQGHKPNWSIQPDNVRGPFLAKARKRLIDQLQNPSVQQLREFEDELNLEEYLCRPDRDTSRGWSQLEARP